MSNLFPRLADCRTYATIKDLLKRMIASRDAPMGPEYRRVVRAVMLMLDDELRFRNPRRRPLVDRTASAKSEGG